MKKIIWLFLMIISIQASARTEDIVLCAQANAEAGCTFGDIISSTPTALAIDVVDAATGASEGQCNIIYTQETPVPDSAPEYRNPGKQCGSILRVDQLTSGESLPIAGTGETLNYNSGRDPARMVDYKINLPLTTTPHESDLTSITVEVDIAGQHYSYPFTTITDGMLFSFTWDGKDNTGAWVNGAAMATIKVHYFFTVPGLTVPDIPHTFNVPLGKFKALQFGGFGGWSYSGMNYYDPVGQRIYFGNGDSQDAPVTMVTINGSGQVAVVGGSPFDYYMVANKDANEAYFFDSNGFQQQTRSTLTGALLKTFTYSSGSLTSITDSFGKTTSFSRTSGTITITAPYGQVTTLSLDGSGRVQTVTDPSSHVWTMAYDTSGLLHTIQKPNGATNTFSYDGDGRLTEDHHSAGADLTFAQSMLYNGTEASSTITMSTAAGPQTTYMINSYPTSYERFETLPQYAIQKYYEYASNTEYINSPTGMSTTRATSSDARFGWQDPYTSGFTKSDGTQNISGYGYFNSYVFTSSDLLNLTSDSYHYVPDSQDWHRVYDGSTKTNSWTSPEGRVTSTQYNSVNQVVQTQSYGYSPFVYAYDTDGRLHTITQSSRVTTINYGTDGFVSSVQNPASKTTSFTYYADGKVHTQTLPDSSVLTYSYDSDGNLASVQTATSHTHSLLSNLYDLIQSYTAPSIGGGSYVTSYGYNNNRQLTSITLPDSSTITYSYNSVTGRLDSYTTPEGTYNNTYDYFGILTQVTSPQSVTNGFNHDGDFTTFASTSTGSYYASVSHHRSTMLEDRITVTDNSSNASNVSYSYDNDNLIVAAGDLSIIRDPSTAQVAETDLGNIQELYSYDPTYGEVSTYQVKYSGTEIYKEQYTRDLLGRITTKVVTVNGSTVTTYDYTYDDNGRLHYVYVNSTLTRTYNYDDNSNRTSLVAGTTTSGTYDAQDRISTYGSNTYTETTNGYVSQITDGTNTTNLTYDTLGSLTSAQIITGAGTDNYTYLNDALGRRIERKKNGTLQKRYLYDEKGRLMAELDGSGNLVSQFVYATMSNSPDYMIQSGTKYKLIHDQLGSVVMVVDSSTGSVASSITYDEFGNITASSTPEFQPFGFAGGLLDMPTGFVRSGVRDYDPETGRWTSKDPILFNGGDMNLYGYVLADPVNLIDPSGNNPLIAAPIIGGLTGAIIGGISAGINGGNIGTGAWSGFVGGATAGLGLATGFGAGAAIFAGTLTNVLTALPDSGADPGDVGNGFRSLLEPKKKQCP